ncbi:MAG TPA: protein kinase [Candidatus Nanopelagicales bacterium]|nr:protein kinase [Candidatus Nanopelagicales bacterium]
MKNKGDTFSTFGDSVHSPDEPYLGKRIRSSLPPGTRVGAYIIGDLLGQGGFGAVYRATHADRGAPAALKILHGDLASRPAVVLRFEREVEVIERIRHPGVVQILEHGRCDDGTLFVAMELLEGMTLEQHLRLRGRLGPAEVLSILEPLAAALEAAHAHAVVHRDIKASNVFLTEHEGRRRVVLLDFGIAKLLDVSEPALTASREIVGTFSSISPEQLLNQPVDARTDVYGLGVLTYRMLVGEMPFQSQVHVVMRHLHLHATPPPPSARARVNPAYDDVILRAMNKAPAARYPTVAAFLEAMHATTDVAQARRSDPQITRRAVAVHAEVRSAPGARSDAEPDHGALIEAALSALSTELTAAGLSIVVETGASMLLSLLLPEDPAKDLEERRRSLDTALTAYRNLEARSALHGQLHVLLCLHAGEVITTPDGLPVSGDLLDVGGWIPDHLDQGVFASPAVLRGTNSAVLPIADGDVARLS